MTIDVHSGRVPKIRSYLRPRKHTPTLYRDPSHCPEEGVGGAAYWVTYVGEPIGVVVSTWSLADGEHWRAYDAASYLMLKADRTPKTFATLPRAVSFLLTVVGWQGGYRASTH